MSAVAVQRRFAIVEDEPAMSQMVSDMLAGCGVDVEVFGLGAQLLKSAHLPQFESIILDLSLPDIEGFDMMERLAACEANASILLISGHDRAIVTAAKIYGHGIGLNMRAALSKPFSRSELLAALGLPQ